MYMHLILNMTNTTQTSAHIGFVCGWKWSS